jgi:hypothetical protein
MSNPAQLGAVEYEAESAFGEATATFATHRIPILGPPDLSGLKHPNITPENVQQYLQGGSAPIVGVMDGSTFKTRMYLAGHGSSTSGATSVDPIETFLGLVLGNVPVVSASAGTTLTGGTITVPTTTASGTFLAGSLAPIGALGDGDGEGQMYAIASHSAQDLTLLTDMPGAPANGAVLYSAVNLYLPEDPTDAGVTSVRFRVMTGNLRYLLHGCYPTAFTLSGLSTGQVPICEITWGVARWTLSTGGTFPSTVTSNAYTPASNAAGSMFIQDVGTSTRATQTFRDLQIAVTLGHVPLMGPGGVGAYQGVVGCVRQPTKIEITWTGDADTVTTSPGLNTIFDSTTGKHILISLSTFNGKRVGLYFPKVFFRNDRPVQFNDGGVNRLRVTGEAHTGPTNTSNLTLSAMRIALA